MAKVTDTKRIGATARQGRRADAARYGVAWLLAGIGLAGCAHVPDQSSDNPIVRTAAGSVHGSTETEAGHKIRVFRGIPYAEAPVADLRWRPPVPAKRWQGVREATDFGPPCYQPVMRPELNNIYYEKLAAMSEDCLSLNIWAPDHSKKAPVFVWFHGGALISGTSASAMYDGTRLAEQGVIVVTVNYRLGVLGYLAHPELSAESNEGISGNYGLLDQIEALRWVKQNIATFGGDPDNVTIAGESAGALSVMYLMTSPLARGLFGKAVMESPYMVSTPALKTSQHGHPSAESMGVWLQQKLGVSGVAAMRAMAPDALVERSIGAGFQTWATIDGKVLPRQSVEEFDRGEQAKVPILAGFNSGEMRSLRSLVPPAPASTAEYEAKVRAAYGDTAERYLSAYPSDNMDDSLLAAERDALYGWTVQRMAVKQAEAGQPAYLYLFDHGYPAADAAGLHAFHASEVPFVFGTIGKTPQNWPEIPQTEGQRALSDAMVRYWASFARDGRPVAKGQIDWPSFYGKQTFMVFRDEPTIENDVLGDRYDLNEETVCRRRAAGNQPWNFNVGILSPPLPPLVPNCRK